MPSPTSKSRAARSKFICDEAICKAICISSDEEEKETTDDEDSSATDEGTDDESSVDGQYEATRRISQDYCGSGSDGWVQKLFDCLDRIEQQFDQLRQQADAREDAVNQKIEQLKEQMKKLCEMLLKK